MTCPNSSLQPSDDGGDDPFALRMTLFVLNTLVATISLLLLVAFWRRRNVSSLRKRGPVLQSFLVLGGLLLISFTAACMMVRRLTCPIILFVVTLGFVSYTVPMLFRCIRLYLIYHVSLAHLKTKRLTVCFNEPTGASMVDGDGRFSVTPAPLAAPTAPAASSSAPNPPSSLRRKGSGRFPGLPPPSSPSQDRSLGLPLASPSHESLASLDPPPPAATSQLTSSSSGGLFGDEDDDKEEEEEEDLYPNISPGVSRRGSGMGRSYGSGRALVGRDGETSTTFSVDDADDEEIERAYEAYEEDQRSVQETQTLLSSEADSAAVPLQTISRGRDEAGKQMFSILDKSADRSIRKIVGWNNRLSERFLSWTFILVLVVIFVTVLVVGLTYFNSGTTAPGQEIGCLCEERERTGIQIVTYFMVFTMVAKIIFIYALRNVDDEFSINTELKAASLANVGLLAPFIVMQFVDDKFLLWPFGPTPGFLLLSHYVFISFLGVWLPLFQSYGWCLLRKGHFSGSKKSLKKGRAYSTTTLVENLLRATEQDIPFEFFLNDPKAKAAFRTHLAHEFSLENLIFWEEATKYKRLQNKRAIRRQCDMLCNDFIKVGSPMELNLADFIRSEILAKSVSNRPDLTMFDDGIEVVLGTLRNDSFPRFLRSKWFLRYQATVLELHAKLHMAGLQ